MINAEFDRKIKMAMKMDIDDMVLRFSILDGRFIYPSQKMNSILRIRIQNPLFKKKISAGMFSGFSPLAVGHGWNTSFTE